MSEIQLANYDQDLQVVEAPSSFVIGQNDFTLLVDAFPTARRYAMIFSKDRSCVSANQFRFEIHSSGFVVVGGLGVPEYPYHPVSQDPNTYGSDLHTLAPLPLNVWSTLALVREGKNIILYLNGAEVDRYQTPTVENHQNPVNLRLGSRFPPGSGNTAENPFPGKLHNARVFTRALKGEEVSRLGMSAVDQLVGREILIRAKCSNLYLEAKDSSKDNGAKIVQGPLTKNLSQVWTLTKHDEDGSYSLFQKNSGLVLDVRGAGKDDGVELIQWGFHGGQNQRFTFQPHFDDYSWQITAVHSGKVLNIRDSGKDSGTDLIQFNATGNDNQRFYIVQAALIAICPPVGGQSIEVTGPVLNLPLLKLVPAVEIGFSLSASSFYDLGHAPRARVRLDNTTYIGPKSWSAGFLDANQWVQVSSQTIRKWREIVTQGRFDAAQWVTKYKVSYSFDGINWMFADNGTVFEANIDQNSKVKNTFATPFLARFVRVCPVEWSSYISLRFELYYEYENEKLPCVPAGLPKGRLLPVLSGLGFYSYASSIYDLNHSEERALLNYKPSQGAHGWAAALSDTNQFFHVASQTVQRWVAIETQGRGDCQQWVTSYKVEFTLDGVTWTSADKGRVFEGNNDSTTIVRRLFENPFFARAVRIRPVTWNGYIAMRLELYVEEEDFSIGILSTQASISNSKLVGSISSGSYVTTTSCYDPNSTIERIRIDYTPREGSSGWVAGFNDFQQYVQVSTQIIRRWAAIETQGCSGSNQWITSYLVLYTLDGLTWLTADNGRIFTANSDENTKVRNTFQTPFFARSVRVKPISWHGSISLRLEVFYEDFDVPVQPGSNFRGRVCGGETNQQVEYHQVLYIVEGGRTLALAVQPDNTLAFEDSDPENVNQHFLLQGSGGKATGGYVFLEPRISISTSTTQIRFESLLSLLLALKITVTDLSVFQTKPAPKTSTLTVVNSTSEVISLYRVASTGVTTILTIVPVGLTVSVRPVFLGTKIKAVSNLNKIWEFVVDEVEEHWNLTAGGWSGTVGHFTEDHNVGLSILGRWIGNYPGAGDQIIEISRSGNKFIATKITGDNQVPAGQITWRVTIDDEGATTLRGEGQVAQPGYVNPSFGPGQLTIISNVQISFWWSVWGTVVYRRYVETNVGITTGGSLSPVVCICPSPNVQKPELVETKWGANLVGQWIGHYCGCGDEIVDIKFVGDQLVCTKITGDNYVPAGEVTWKCTMTSGTTGDGDGQLAYPGHTSPYWVKGKLNVKDANNLTFGCPFPLVPYRRKL